MGVTVPVLRVLGLTNQPTAEERHTADVLCVASGAKTVVRISSRPAVFEQIRLIRELHQTELIRLEAPWRFDGDLAVLGIGGARAYFRDQLQRAVDLIRPVFPELQVETVIHESLLQDQVWEQPLAPKVTILCLDCRLDRIAAIRFEAGHLVIRLPGGPSSLTGATGRSAAEFMLYQLGKVQEEFLRAGGQLEEIHLCSHWDCAAKGGTSHSPRAEVAKHRADAQKAACVVAEHFTGLGWSVPAMEGGLYRLNGEFIPFNM